MNNQDKNPLQRPLKKKVLSSEESREMMSELRGKMYESMHPKPNLADKLKSKMTKDLGDKLITWSFIGGLGGFAFSEYPATSLCLACGTAYAGQKIKDYAATKEDRRNSRDIVYKTSNI